jgi:hypothetical protein
VTANEIRALVRQVVEHQRTAIRWERVLLSSLVLTASIETAAGVLTRDWR